VDSRIETTNPLGYGPQTQAGSLLPSYSAGSNEHLDLPCDIEIRQSMSAVYDPKPEEGFSDLDIQGGGDFPGLGIFKLFHYSSLVSFLSGRQSALMSVVRRCIGQDPLGAARSFAGGYHLRSSTLLDTDTGGVDVFLRL
jgi:hypothetical protein